ncbi:MAG: hypothetical protein AAFW97_14705 [Pseudomonadota bacterium]
MTPRRSPHDAALLAQIVATIPPPPGANPMADIFRRAERAGYRPTVTASGAVWTRSEALGEAA